MADSALSIRSRLYLPGWMSFFILAHFFHHLLGTILPPLLPMIRSEFSLGYTQAGLVISAFSVSYGISQLPGGWLGDRLGPRVTMALTICGMALAGFFVGLSHSFAAIIPLFILMGLMGGGYHPAAPPLIAALVGQENRGRGMGFHMLGGNASHFLGPLIALAIATSWGWRASFIGLAVPAMIFGFILYSLLGRVAPVPAPKAKDTPRPVSSWAPGQLRRLIAFICLANFSGGIIVAVASFVPLFLIDQFGASKGTAGVLYSLIFAVGFVVSPLGGYLSDRLGPVPMLLGTCLLAGPILYLLNLAPYIGGTTIVLLLIGVTLNLRNPASESFIVGQATEGNRSLVLGFYYFGNIEGGGILTPALGYLIDHFGFAAGFSAAGAALLAATLACYPLLRERSGGK